MTACIFIRIVFLLGSSLLPSAYSFATLPPPIHLRFQALESLSSRKGTNDNSATSCSTSIVTGVSVSPTGFWVVVPVPNDDDDDTTYLPLLVSTADTTGAATSAAALTILQLLASVDMAGAVFPPETLTRILQSEASNLLRFEYVQAAANIGGGDTGTNDSFLFSLHCTSLEDEDVSMNIPLNENFLPEALATDGTTTLAFLAIALALRYQVPLRWTTTNNASLGSTTLEDIRDRFPAFQTTQRAVLQPAQASAAQLEQGFEIHTLQAALKLARDKGDDVAAAKIRARIDQWDAQSFEQLPVQPESDTSSMQ